MTEGYQHRFGERDGAPEVNETICKDSRPLFFVLSPFLVAFIKLSSLSPFLVRGERDDMQRLPTPFLCPFIKLSSLSPFLVEATGARPAQRCCPEWDYAAD